MRSPAPDWNVLATHALEIVSRPAFVLDADLIVRAWNAAMESLTGRARDGAIGRAWADIHGDADRGLEPALARDRSETTVKLSIGDRRVALKLSLARAGETLTLVTVLDHHVLDEERARGEGDLVYEIAGAGLDRFRLRDVRGDPRRARAAAVGDRCFEALQGRSTPCPGCPTPEMRADETRTAVIPSGAGAEEPIRIVVARGQGDAIRVSSFDVDDEKLWSLVEAKVRLLARRADLSARERDVLLWLVRGRTPQDVATLLGIAPRTVKFHQANVLRKLGAESRSDLLRLIF